MQRFIGKKPHRKLFKPILNSRVPHKVPKTDNKIEEIKVEDKPKVTKNKKESKNNDMNEKINEINDVLNNEKAPKRKVKVEKKDKGLFERTENSTILITEDNKMLLND